MKNFNHSAYGEIYLLALNMYKDNFPDPGFRGCSTPPFGNGCNCENDSECMEGSICGYQWQTRQCVPMAGTKVPRFIGVDQFGDVLVVFDLICHVLQHH